AGGRPSKWDNACRLAMALSYLVLAGGDSVGLVCFDTEPRDFVPSRTSFGQLEVLDSVMDRRRPGAETRLAHALEMAVGRVKRRSLIILVSDLLGEPEAVLKVASALQARRHELMVLQVLDPAERDFPFDGPTVFESLEDSSRLYCDASALRAGYRGAFARQQRLYEAGFNSAAVSFITSYTDRPWDEDLVRLLGVRGSAR
ncbi:MAG TPA: hypothetical protein DEB40_04095, partial [Elusimicrobia bacterium]|nr:hypothetical protein [Elusimicrobiota bacterium]